MIEDAACAIGSEVRWDGAWQRIGRPHGDVACFSFHPRKLLSTGDGGMITTARPDVDATCRALRQHGMSVPDTVRHASSAVVFERYPLLGFNYRMTDIQAAIGREQLHRLPEVVARRTSTRARTRAFTVEPEVTINNQWSERYTVIEVSGLDRPGLLYQLTTTISKLNLNIASAHVATFGERARDVFYVTDLLGAQITAPTRQAAIKRALVHLLAEGGEANKPAD